MPAIITTKPPDQLLTLNIEGPLAAEGILALLIKCSRSRRAGTARLRSKTDFAKDDKPEVEDILVLSDEYFGRRKSKAMER